LIHANIIGGKGYMNLFPGWIIGLNGNQGKECKKGIPVTVVVDWSWLTLIWFHGEIPTGEGVLCATIVRYNTCWRLQKCTGKYSGSTLELCEKLLSEYIHGTFIMLAISAFHENSKGGPCVFQNGTYVFAWNVVWTVVFDLIV
jgi:hypothetical protein